MIKTLIIVAGCLAVAVAGILIYAATKPDTFRVARSVTIKAPPDKIFPLINDYRQWTAWSPYENKDPQMKRTYGSVTAGKGATYAWEGDGNVGAGNMVIADTSPPSKVMIELSMVKPITAHNDVTFTLVPQGDGTTVTWNMQGPVPYLIKIMHVFLNMDKMVGSDFEAGLANLKAAAESR
jgi:uncharacterized protein YndB with AHSA1/START domain